MLCAPEILRTHSKLFASDNYSLGRMICLIAEAEVVAVGAKRISNNVVLVVLINELIPTALWVVLYQGPPLKLNTILGVKLYRAPF